jgi:GntR family transcriptional regulator, transcriptional repressor for pyruvate dehydrogenase complex
MADPLTPIERTPLYREVFDRLHDLVESEDLAPGDRLPAERELSVRLGVSRNSLRPALAALEALGVIEIRHGSGAFLKRTTLTEVASSFAEVLLEQNAQLPAAMEARMAVERFAVGLAAGRRTDEDLNNLQAALDAMAAEIARGEDGTDGDRAFHRAVAEAAHNPVLVKLMRNLERDIARIRAESLAQRGRPKRSLSAHRRIFAAIRDADPRTAVAEMDAHLAEVADTPLVRR